MKKAWLLAIVGVLIVGAGAWFFFRGSSGEGQPQFTTVAVDRGNVVGRVTATGTLSALVTVLVGTQVSGRIKELKVDFNSPVKKGQELAKIDPELFLAAIAQAKANEQAAAGNLARAQAQARDFELKLRRATQLADKELISKADRDTAQADFDMARASIVAAEGSLALAQASHHQAEVNLAYTSITSPIDGTVISRSVDVGQTVAASFQTPTLFTIAENLARMQVDTSVAEADVGKLKEGAEATFSVDAFPNRRFKGRIRQIRFAPQTVQNVVTYDAVIDVDNAELVLRPGMTANVTFIYARAEDVLRVPNAALRFRLDTGGGRGRGGGRGPGAMATADAGPGRGRDGGGGLGWSEREVAGAAAQHDVRTVYVLREGQPQAVTLRVGISDGSTTEVVSGDLKEGDPVITERLTEAGSKPPAGLGMPAGGGGRRGPF